MPLRVDVSDAVRNLSDVGVFQRYVRCGDCGEVVIASSAYAGVVISSIRPSATVDLDN